MPTAYSGREEEEDPSTERAPMRKPMQPMQAGQPAQAYQSRTFQQPTMPGGTPGQQSAMPWTSSLGGGDRAPTTPWSQGMGNTMQTLGAAQGLQGQDTRAFSMDPQRNQQMGAQSAMNSAYGQQQAAAQRANQGFGQNQSINAQLGANNAAYGQQQAQNQRLVQNSMGGGGGMQTPDWSALAARMGGGAPIARDPAALMGGGGQGPMAGGNPWLQNMLGGLAQRFAGLQRGGAQPGGSASPSSRLWAGPGRR